MLGSRYPVRWYIRTMVGNVRLWAALAIAGCAKPPPPPAPVEVVFGDCATVDATFVVGPVPQAFAPADIGRKDTLYASRGVRADVLAGFADPRVEEDHASDRAVDLRFQTRYQDLKGPPSTGSGYGSRGGVRRAYVNRGLPTAKLVDPVVSGDLPPPIVRRYLKRNIQRLMYCYEKALLYKPDLGGTLNAELEASADGVVVSSSAVGIDTGLAQCVADVLRRIELPKPQDGKTVRATFALVFRPNEMEAGHSDVTAVKAIGLPPVPPSSAKPPEPRPRGTIFGLAHVEAYPAGSSDTSYQAGASTPLAPLRDGLATCWRRQRATSGTAVIELGAGKLGVYGIADAGLQACVSALGVKLPAVAPQRCAVAFGHIGAAHATGIDVTEQSITVGDQRLPVVHDLGAPWWELRSVTDVVRGRASAALEHTAVVTTLGPLVVRPLPSTPMGVVMQVLHSAMAGGGDPILAAQRNSEWKLLRDQHLPVVPTPLATGGSFSDDIFSQRADSETATLSILVGQDRTVVAFSRDNDIAKVPVSDVAALEKVLRDRKATPILAERTYAEIAAEDDATYGRLVEVIDLLERVGFTGWTVTSLVASGANFPYN